MRCMRELRAYQLELLHNRHRTIRGGKALEYADLNYPYRRCRAHEIHKGIRIWQHEPPM